MRGLHMKKAVIKWSIFLAIVLIAVCAIRVNRSHLVLYSQIERIEFQGYHSCDGPVSETVVLSEDEARKVLTHFNFSSYAGQVNAEGCTHDFKFVIYLKNGKLIRINEAGHFGLEVEQPKGQYWIKSDALANYAQELIEKYGLLVSE